MRKYIVMLCLVLFMPTGARAASDIVATYSYSNGTKITLCARDAEHVRMDSSPTAYTLLYNGKVYQVNCDDGPCQVYDLGAMAGMGSGLSSMFGGGEAEYDIRFKNTGRTETIAGYKGTVYETTFLEDGKVVSREETVLSTHTNIKKVNDAWIAMTEALTKTMDKSFLDSLNEAKAKNYGGMLRYGDQMRLTKLSVKNLNASYYKLPANAQQVQINQPQQQDNGMGLDNDAKEIGHDAKEATKDEIKSGIRDAISDLFN